MPSALELRAQERVHDGHCGAFAHDARAKGDDVGVVVPAGHFGRVGLRAHRGAHALHPVRRQRNADARAADQHAQLALAARHRAAHLLAVYRIVHRLGAVAAVVNHLIALFLQVLFDRQLQRIAAVVAADRNLHSAFSFMSYCLSSYHTSAPKASRSMRFSTPFGRARDTRRETDDRSAGSTRKARTRRKSRIFGRFRTR